MKNKESRKVGGLVLSDACSSEQDLDIYLEMCRQAEHWEWELDSLQWLTSDLNHRKT